MLIRVYAILSLLLLGAQGLAHDLWLIPEEKGALEKPFLIRANSGSDFPKSEHAPDPSKFAKLQLIKPHGSTGVLKASGTAEMSGLLQFTPNSPGIYIAAVETTPKLITLDADKFNQYLVSDGLPHIFQLRFKEKSLDQPGKERYSKSPKVILRVGTGGKGDPCRILDLPLEIVPLSDPFALKIGETIKVRVLFREKPLADANLGWDHPHEGQSPSGTVRTDKKGEARIPIAQTGLMTIRLTHMTRPKEKDFEWESFWTTLTFRISE